MRALAAFKSRLFRHGVRYTLVGIWNTIFGIGCYTLLVMLFGQKHYLWLGVISNILAITNAFLCYKFFVFKTKGYFWSEYFKCYVVYGGGMLTGMFLMYISVSLLGFDAIFANLAVTFIVFCFSYLGHRFFSFHHK